jgi:TRAP-type mannitol/chloroaromatic compound transport system permease large subunit
VLIILADQLSSAADQASTARKADFKAATGEFSMPSELDITSASAGDMFMGAFIPGLVLVGLYMAYIMITAIIRPKLAPPVPYDGKYDRAFAWRVFLALVPPLTLIFAVLGSIVLGIATVNQAGAIGAVGAMVMGGYRLSAGSKGAYSPAILALASIVGIGVVLSLFDLNVKNIQGTRDAVGIALAAIAVAGLLIAVIWSGWRAYRVDNTLNGVMIDTAKTTSMVFIILIGAAMLTSAFRAFGGEELVKHFLTGLPGGFWTQFIVVMMVIFVLGFFLDFIEIAVVVVPIVAPILLADPGANVTAVWLGVMVGLNIQTSFLTPPFGFALFYLRGVAPPTVKTTQIYKGAAAFIMLQLLGLAIAGFFPHLVNYLPNRTYLTSDTAPPPMNPRLQYCLEEQVFADYDVRGDALRASIEGARTMDLSYLPDAYQKSVSDSFDNALATFALVDEVRDAESSLTAYAPEYAPLHRQVRALQAESRKYDATIENLEKDRTRFARAKEVDEEAMKRLDARIETLKAEREERAANIPGDWNEARENYVNLADTKKKARRNYRQNVDAAYEPVAALMVVVTQHEALAALGERLEALRAAIENDPPDAAMETIKGEEAAFGELDGTSKIKSALSKSRRALKGDSPDREKSITLLDQALELYAADLAWRERAAEDLLPALTVYNDAIKDSIGLRMQKRLSVDQAEETASCLAVHRDVSLSF